MLTMKRVGFYFKETNNNWVMGLHAKRQATVEQKEQWFDELGASPDRFLAFYIKKKILSSHFIRCHLVSVVVRVLTLHISIFVSEATWHIRTKLCKNVHQMVLYKVWVIVVDRRFNIAARTNNTFWLSEIINLLIRKNPEPIGLWYCSNAH
jgi:hypothetical protein